MLRQLRAHHGLVLGRTVMPHGQLERNETETWRSPAERCSRKPHDSQEREWREEIRSDILLGNTTGERVTVSIYNTPPSSPVKEKPQAEHPLREMLRRRSVSHCTVFQILKHLHRSYWVSIPHPKYQNPLRVHNQKVSDFRAFQISDFQMSDAQSVPVFGR